MTSKTQHHPDQHRARRVRCLVLGLTMSVIGLPGLVPGAAHADSGPTPLVTQIADEPVSVSASAFRRDLFVAADAARLSDPDSSADLLGERVLQHMYALAPQTDPAAAAAAVQTLRDAAASVTGPAFDSRITRTMVLFQGAAAADRGPTAATLQRATTEVLTLTAQQVVAVTADTHAENALGTTGDTESRLLISPTFMPTAVLRDSAAQADTNPRFATARDLLWGKAAGASISATSADLLQTAPRLEDNPAVQALAGLRDASGAINTTGGVIAGTPDQPAANTIGATMAELGNALADSREAAAASTGPTPVDDAVAEQALEDARDSQTTLALQTGFLTGSSSAAKDLVDQVGAVGIQVALLATSFNDFRSGAIGSAALSGNVVGVVMTLLPAVLEWAGVFGPSPEDLVTTQLDNISQQMADFQNAVTGQFTQVFESLSRVSAQLDDISQKLDRAVIDIEQARVQIGQMYDSLSKLQGSLDAVQDNILEALRNGTNSQLRQTISSALGYAERNGSPLPLDEFNNAAAYLHTFLTVTARHSPDLNTDHPTFDLQDDANQLSTGIASNVHFLDQVPAQRGWAAGRLSGLTGDAPQLANMDDFVLASRAYAQLMLENTGYVSAGYRRWLTDIQQLGGPLADLTSAISTSDTTTGTRSTLLDHLVCARTMAAFKPSTTPPCQPETEDTTAVDTLVDQAAGQLTGSFPGYDGAGNQIGAALTTPGSTTFDPFVRTATDASDLSTLWSGLTGRGEVSPCAPQTGALPAKPDNMTRPTSLTPDSQGVPSVFQWADRMGLGTLDVCWQSRTRTIGLHGCLLGKYVMVNNIPTSSCPDTDFDGDGGTDIGVAYKYDDIAFVWTYTAAQAGSLPVYVQSQVRHGAGTSSVTGQSLVKDLPEGGYVNPTSGTLLSSGTLVPGRIGRFVLDDSKAKTVANLYSAPSSAAEVSTRWDDATTGLASYQGTTGPILGATPAVPGTAITPPVAATPGDALDQPIAGLDPKLGTSAVKYARTCTAAEQSATPSPCETGTGDTRIISLKSATQSVSDAVDAKLVGLQGDLYRKLVSGPQTAGSTSSGPLHDALVRLDGANSMLSSFLQLGASAALRAQDLTGFTSGLEGSKALVAAIKAEVARTAAGKKATAPRQLVTSVLDPGALDDLDGLLPAPSGRAVGAAGTAQRTVGPVNPAILATNDQLTLTAIALGAPPAVATPTTPTPPVPASSSPSTSHGPVAVVHVVFGRGWRSGARVDKRYKARITASGGTNTFSWARRGSLPRGLEGKASRAGDAYVIRGRTAQTGVFRFTLTATDASGASTTKRYTIRVS